MTGSACLSKGPQICQISSAMPKQNGLRSLMVATCLRYMMISPAWAYDSNMFWLYELYKHYCLLLTLTMTPAFWLVKIEDLELGSVSFMTTSFGQPLTHLLAIDYSHIVKCTVHLIISYDLPTSSGKKKTQKNIAPKSGNISIQKIR